MVSRRNLNFEIPAHCVPSVYKGRTWTGLRARTSTLNWEWKQIDSRWNIIGVIDLSDQIQTPVTWDLESVEVIVIQLKGSCFACKRPHMLSEEPPGRTWKDLWRAVISQDRQHRACRLFFVNSFLKCFPIEFIFSDWMKMRGYYNALLCQHSIVKHYSLPRSKITLVFVLFCFSYYSLTWSVTYWKPSAEH